MKHKRFCLFIRYLDTEVILKREFDLRCDATVFFNGFRGVVGNRPVVVTLYDGVVPCWVYHSQYTITLSQADKIFRSGDVYYMAYLPQPRTNEFICKFFNYEKKYCFEIHHLTAGDMRRIYKQYPNVYNWLEELPF